MSPESAQEPGTESAPGYGHPRSHRLLTPGDFRAVFDQVAVKSACPELLLLSRPAQSGSARLGFILAKKNIRTAVARNRIKRCAREVFRLHYADWPPLDIILMGRKELGLLTHEQLHELIDKQLRRLTRRWHKAAAESA
ncbi:MAG: ribonuclease P protein component [Saccharospirillum sp.]|uniref:ribonuclease P protein component n=1 Tax=Saccharospirillum sp. TaxID=2033801 RepID=UPI00329907A2